MAVAKYQTENMAKVLILRTYTLLVLEPRTDNPFTDTWISTSILILPKFKELLNLIYFKAGM